MSVRKLKTTIDTSYFVTFTNCNWLPLFEVTNFYQKLYDWFEFLIKNGDKIIGYVLMPNHLHAVIYLQKESPCINKVIGEAKRLMSYSIVSRLRKAKQTDFLLQLESAVSPYERLKGLKHKVFEESFDGKECASIEMMNQKLNYIHQNPVRAGFVATPEDYIHSSARYYLTGVQSHVFITHVIELFYGIEDFEFSKKYLFK